MQRYKTTIYVYSLDALSYFPLDKYVIIDCQLTWPRQTSFWMYKKVGICTGDIIIHFINLIFLQTEYTWMNTHTWPAIMLMFTSILNK